MADKTIRRGDDYWKDRPIFTIEIFEDALPLDMTGCTIRSTWRTEVIEPGIDPDDSTAILAAFATFDGTGVITDSENFDIPDGDVAADGRFVIVADKTVTANMELASGVKGDVQVTDAFGHTQTIILLDELTIEDGYTSATT